MNTIQTNFLYNLIFFNTKYERDGHFLGNKAFIRKNNKLAQIEFLKGNKIGENKDLRDITIKVKLKSTSANEEEIEACMSFYDETHKMFLADFNELNSIDIAEIDVAREYEDDVFRFVGNGSYCNSDLYASWLCEIMQEDKDYEEIDQEIRTLTEEQKISYTLDYFFCTIGQDISKFLDFIFDQKEKE